MESGWPLILHLRHTRMRATASWRGSQEQLIHSSHSGGAKLETLPWLMLKNADISQTIPRTREGMPSCEPASFCKCFGRDEEK
jgi:hypothetical protein